MFGYYILLWAFWHHVLLKVQLLYCHWQSWSKGNKLRYWIALYFAEEQLTALYIPE